MKEKQNIYIYIYIRRTRKILGTKFYSRNLIKRNKNPDSHLVRLSGPFLKWTTEEFRKNDQKTRKLRTTGWKDKIVVQKKTPLQLYSKTFIEKITVAAFSFNHRLDIDPKLGACLFHKRRRGLGEYSVDGSDQAGFGVVGGHVGDVLDIWPNEVVQRVQVGEGGGQWEKGSKS